jgi:predicted metal-binding membrane protein
MFLSQPLSSLAARSESPAAGGWLAFAAGFRPRAPAAMLGASAAIAWAGLAAMLLGQSSAPSAGPSPWWCMADMTPTSRGAGAGVSALAGLPMWALMSMAMMLPSFVPAMSAAALRARRAGRLIVSCTAIYLSMWVAFGVGALYLRAALASMGDTALVLALVLAASWELTPQKARRLLECRRSLKAPDVCAGDGLRAGAMLGARLGASCLGSCWALMLVMAFAASEQLLWALGLTLLVSAQKLGVVSALRRRSSAPRSARSCSWSAPSSCPAARRSP